MMLYAAFLNAAKNTGAIVTAGYKDDTRDWIEILKPEIIHVDTPRNGEIAVVMGAMQGHSDFGDGALTLKQFLLNVICLNGLVGRQILREIHLGRQIEQEITLSEKTVILDSELKASIITDSMNSLFSKEDYKFHVERILEVSSTIVKDVDERIKVLSKVGVSKEEQKALALILMNGNVDDGVQGDMTLWKFAQGISALARTPGQRRSVELMEVSGNIIYNN